MSQLGHKLSLHQANAGLGLQLDHNHFPAYPVELSILQSGFHSMIIQSEILIVLVNHKNILFSSDVCHFFEGEVHPNNI